MSEQPVLWIAACAFLSAGLVWIQYFYGTKQPAARWPLAGMRFLSVLGILLLLADVQVTTRKTRLEKQQLILLADNSRSLVLKGQDSLALQLHKDLANSRELADRFDLQSYSFGPAMQPLDSLDFSLQGTDIAGTLAELSNALLSGEASILLLTDGNDNLGSDYRTLGSQLPPVYPVILGDTTQYFDLRIDRINVNRFAFKGNQYPLEILWSFTGEESGSSQMTIRDNGRVVSRETIRWEGGRQSGVVERLLEASEVGFHRIEVSLTPIEAERNIENNDQTVGLEVVDERLDIRIVSRLTHPDLGAFKRSLLQNQQRECRIETPEETLTSLDDAGLIILFQPDRSFANLYEALSGRNIPSITVAGPATDWQFLNGSQERFQIKNPGPPEYFFPEKNGSFSFFDASGWDLSSYPPLEGVLGDYSIGADHQVLIEQKVRGLNLGQPLLALIRETPRQAVFFGSGIWKWRLQAFRDTGDTESFDQALTKMVLFLTAGRADRRLTLDYQPIYQGLPGATIRARLVDEAFVFDPGARLILELEDGNGTRIPGSPMSLRSGYYQYDLSQLDPGSYTFRVRAEGTEFAASGAFELEAIDIEARQITADAAGLKRLAEDSGGFAVFPSQLQALKDTLLQSDRFRPVQKSQVNVVSLIDYRWLLALIVLCLSGEWFLRKYKGLI